MNTNNFHTDMAVEAAEYSGVLENCAQIKAISREIKRTRVDIKDELTSKKLGKRKGVYITYEVSSGIERDEVRNKLVTTLRDAIIELTAPSLKNKPSVLVVGLGNRNITADALGAAVTDRLIITRPLFQNGLPTYGLTELSALTAGVYGVTGIESFDVVAGVINQLAPDILLVVDTLAAGKARRLFKSYQLTTAGIEPGSGVKNTRKLIDSKTLGIPVLSIGVPLALYASSIVKEGVEQYLFCFGKSAEIDKLNLARTATLGAENTDMIVAPKAIDKIVESTAEIIASAINLAFQKTTDKVKFIKDRKM